MTANKMYTQGLSIINVTIIGKGCKHFSHAKNIELGSSVTVMQDPIHEDPSAILLLNEGEKSTTIAAIALKLFVKTGPGHTAPKKNISIFLWPVKSESAQWIFHKKIRSFFGFSGYSYWLSHWLNCSYTAARCESIFLFFAPASMTTQTNNNSTGNEEMQHYTQSQKIEE